MAIRIDYRDVLRTIVLRYIDEQSISLNALAEMSNMTSTHLYGVLSKKKNMTLAKLEDLLTIVNYSIAFLPTPPSEPFPELPPPPARINYGTPSEGTPSD
jgi:hypothetical protein